MKFFKIVLGDILSRANSIVGGAGFIYKRDFYGIKDRILQRWGTLVTYDFQHFEGKKCWSCNGTGVYDKYEWGGDLIEQECWSCEGTGWYKRECWVALKRYKLGERTLHIPKERLYTKPEETMHGDNTIEGYISHARQEYGEECLHLIFLLFAPKIFWKMVLNGWWREIPVKYRQWINAKWYTWKVYRENKKIQKIEGDDEDDFESIFRN